MGKQFLRPVYPKFSMFRICPAYASYMSHTFKDMGHIWDVYGTYMGHTTLGRCRAEAQILLFWTFTGKPAGTTGALSTSERNSVHVVKIR